MPRSKHSSTSHPPRLRNQNRRPTQSSISTNQTTAPPCTLTQPPPPPCMFQLAPMTLGSSTVTPFQNQFHHFNFNPIQGTLPLPLDPFQIQSPIPSWNNNMMNFHPNMPLETLPIQMTTPEMIQAYQTLLYNQTVQQEDLLSLGNMLMNPSNNMQYQNSNSPSYQLSNFANLSLNQVLQTLHTPVTQAQLQRFSMEQIVPVMETPSPSFHSTTQNSPPPQVPEQEGSNPNTQGPVMDPIILTEECLTLTFLENAEEKISLQTPPNIRKVSLNIRSCAWSPMQQYVLNLCPAVATNLDLTRGQGMNYHTNPHMKILLWNCRGANNPIFRRNLDAILHANTPSVLALTENRMADHDILLQQLPFTDLLQVPASGFSGEIALLWNNHEVTIEPMVLTEQEIHATVKELEVTRFVA
ncbi:uncharacterized protein [Nicotiana sylvestris]|uniref:uncharacterized protein isoform X1 n=1 Tax=Nicotiana sylvestris TaxID=4096 RepID=UPI00388C4566